MASEKYRDGFFRDLLGLDVGANERFVDVVNATFGLRLSDSDEIKDISLDNVLYTKLRNDVAKMLNGRLIVLVEHQSTVNENMPLRMLEYVAQTYQEQLDSQDRYKSYLQKIPRPLFAVFYNGRADFPQEKLLRLSDAFFGKGNAMLELEVPVININLNKGGEILKQSQVLHDYATLCSNIEECQHRGESDFVRAGILQTIDSGVLVEYLKRNIQEAAGMFDFDGGQEGEQVVAQPPVPPIAEYDYDTDMAVKARENYELGMERGIQATARSMLADNMDAALVARYTSLPLEEVMQLQRGKNNY